MSLSLTDMWLRFVMCFVQTAHWNKFHHRSPFTEKLQKSDTVLEVAHVQLWTQIGVIPKPPLFSSMTLPGLLSQPPRGFVCNVNQSWGGGEVQRGTGLRTASVGATFSRHTF